MLRTRSVAGEKRPPLTRRTLTMQAQLTSVPRSSTAPGRVWLALAIVMAVWLASVRVPMPAAVPYLDSSWAAVQAWILDTRAQSGVDTVFTFGPLGWLNQPTYHAPFFWPQVLGFEIAFKLGVALLCALVLVRRQRVLDVVVGGIAITIAGGGADEFAFVALLSATSWILLDVHRPLALQALASLPLVVFALVKFTYFGLSLCAGLCIFAGFVVVRGWRTALALAGVQLALFALAWIACGQSLANLAAFVRTSLWIASGYGEALGRPGSTAANVLALVAIGCIALHCAMWIAKPCQARWRLALVAFVCVATWVAFKNGFVRNMERRTAFFDFAAACLFLVEASQVAPGTLARMTKYGALIVALAGHGVALGHGFETPSRIFFDTLGRGAKNVAFLSRPIAKRAELDGDLARKRVRYDLPRVRAAVGSDPIDVFACTQAVAILNGLNYRPRPVFQSYAAYTPELQELNAAYMESAAAAPWMLFRYETMDDHAPNIEDARTLEVLLRDYEFELFDRDYLLLKRATHARLPALAEQVLGSARIRFGETVDLDALAGASSASVPGRALRIHVRPTLVGRVASALVKLPPIALALEDERGEVGTFVVAPGYVERGFLVAPYLDSQQRCESWWRGQSGHRVVRATLSIAAGSEWAFSPAVGIELVRAQIVRRNLDPKFEAEALARVFHPTPDGIDLHAPVELVLVREVEACVAGAPSDLRFDLAPGTHTLRAAFGIHGAAWARGDGAVTEFSVILREALGSERVLRRTFVDPVRVEADRVAQQIEIAVASTPGASLVLRTRSESPAPRAGADPYWANVSIRP